MEIASELLLNEAIAIVAEGKTVTIVARGESMAPTINDGDDVIIAKADDLRLGDVVIALTEDYGYVLHRIVDINDSGISLMGDANLVLREQCQSADIKAKVVSPLPRLSMIMRLKRWAMKIRF